MLRRSFLAALALVSLAACGFHLRGPQTLPFSTIYLGMNPYEDFTANAKRLIATTGSTQVVDTLAQAEVQLVVARNEREKYILTLNANGTVREYQLRQRFGFRVLDRVGQEITPYSEIYVTRDVSFSQGLELAKEQEDALLYRDMENDILQQLMRRLARATPRAAEPAASAP
ncbi:MAG: LPS assembly lipoprotein LptE [Candidatus Dactylopiibacterium sp.]|nr:LPS assembly lipoprotein LptE [Candidatus Dactylopiibacterium sp.]